MAKKSTKKDKKKAAVSAKKKAIAKPVKKTVSAKKVAKPAKPPAPKKGPSAKKEPPKKTVKPQAIVRIPAAKKAADKPLKKVISKPVPATAKKVIEEETANSLAEQLVEETAEEAVEPEEVVLTDAEGRRYCRVKDCDQLAAVDGYCRYHYLLFWKKIQVRKKILSEGKLERYIEELTARYPDKFLEMLRKDLRSEKEFLAAIQELEIDESAVDNEFEDEAQTYIDEVRGMGEPGGREEEDF
jgi:hypothetical protein